MVLRHCLACNKLNTESSRSCVCGHVHGDANRYIGGKRFSGYRAELYTRLENKKKKRESREIRKQAQPFQERKNLSVSEKPSFKPKKRQSALTRTSSKKKRNIRLPRLQTDLTKQQETGKSGVPPELLTRFPSALQEINRRLMAQNLVWLALQLG